MCPQAVIEFVFLDFVLLEQPWLFWHGLYS